MRAIKRILQAVAVLCILALAVFGYARYIEPGLLKTNDLQISDKKVTQNVTFALVADFHIGNGNDHTRIEKVASRLNALAPDYVVFLGDLFDDYSSFDGDVNAVANALGSINGKKYAVFGNHDLGGGAKNAYRDVMEQAGFEMLVNSSALIDGNINLVGADDMIFGVPNVGELARSDAYNILLVHEPDFADRVSGFELQLSAHTHGEQVRVPFMAQYILPYGGKNYVHGKYQKTDGSIVYVNRGIGMSQLPLRFASVPEITIVKVGQ